MKHLKSLIICSFVLFSMEGLWSIDSTILLDKNIPGYDETSEKLINFSTTRNRETGELRHDLLKTLKDTFDLDVFVETGTFLGYSCDFAKNIFSEVYTIEISHDLFLNASKRYLDLDNVFVYEGDSPAVLNELLPTISGRILFYLDAHDSGWGSSSSHGTTPILAELSTIRKTNQNQSVILINDMRLFQSSAFPDKIKGTCNEGFPDLKFVVEALLEINPTYQICFLGDALLAYPSDPTISVTTLMRACSITRLSIHFPGFNDRVLENAMHTISETKGNERNELIIYHDVFSPFELEMGFRSLSTLWYGLLLMKDGDIDVATTMLTQAADQSISHWCINLALGKFKDECSTENNLSGNHSASHKRHSHSQYKLSESVLALHQKEMAFLSERLKSQEMAPFSDDDHFLLSFPFELYAPVHLPGQGTFYINQIDDTIKNQLRAQIPWEMENQSIIEKYIKPGTVALDIGSHIGTHTMTMSRCVGKNGKVFAFEPSKVIHRELCYNLAANQCTNVYPIRCAIGKNSGLIEVITSHPKNEGGSYVVNFKGGSNAALLLPLDSLYLDNISFIKIDVENMEAEVIDGAKQTIMQNRPVMLIEIQGNNERPVQLNEDTEKMSIISINKIKNLGYRLKRVGNTRDYLAIPKEYK